MTNLIVTLCSHSEEGDWIRNIHDVDDAKENKSVYFSFDMLGLKIEVVHDKHFGIAILQ